MQTGTHEHTPATSEGDDPRVLELVKEYQAELDRGRRPDRTGFLARHPDLAAVVGPYLDGLDLLHQGAKGLTGSGPGRARLDVGVQPGDRLGEYGLVREVGRGGMGVVFEAWQPSLDRRVAVKVLPAGFAADRTRLRRFTVEAQAAAAVAHPHIVPVYAVGEDRGIHFYVMRLVDGVSLDTLAAAVTTETVPAAPTGAPPGAAPATVSAPPTPPTNPALELTRLSATDRRAYHRAVARLGADVGRALDHAHQSGVVHRDVKPANLLLDRAGHVWVTDFGLAQFADGPTVTRTGATIGTLRYMSPEQAAGDRRRLDHRTDVYSLAATLYELLTGQPAFADEEPAALIHQITHDDPPPLRDVDPAVPTDLETVVLKAMQKDPRDRYATAAEFADDLGRFLDSRPVLARRPSAWDRAKRWAGRHPAAVAAALVSLLVVVTVSAVATVLVAKAYRAEHDRADEAERRFRQAKELSDLVLRISEEEIGADSPMQGPRRRLLLATLENYRTLLADVDDPAVKQDLDRVAKLLAEQAEDREAEPLLQLGRSHDREELNFTAEQTRRFFAIKAEADRRAGDPKRPPGKFGRLEKDGQPGRDWISLPEMRKLINDRAARADLLGLLTPDQRQRLREIFYQDRGPMAFNEPEVVEALHLTTDQRRQIKAIQAEAFTRFMPPGGPGGPRGGPGGGGMGGRIGGPGGSDGPPKGPRDSQAVTKVVDQIVEGVLTSEQQEKWRALIGKPFSFYGRF